MSCLKPVLQSLLMTDVMYSFILNVIILAKPLLSQILESRLGLG